jgi:hypothetical protein
MVAENMLILGSSVKNVVIQTEPEGTHAYVLSSVGASTMASVATGISKDRVLIWGNKCDLWCCNSLSSAE